MSVSLTPDSVLKRILDEAAGPVLDRAKNYVAKRRVGRVLREGDELVADVQGSADEPYRIRIRLGGPNAPNADCSCPVEGEWCKHALAVVLVAKRNPRAVTERPPLKAVLENITKATLVEVVDRLGRPSWRNRIAGLRTAASGIQGFYTPVDSPEWSRNDNICAIFDVTAPTAPSNGAVIPR